MALNVNYGFMLASSYRPLTQAIYHFVCMASKVLLIGELTAIFLNWFQWNHEHTHKGHSIISSSSPSIEKALRIGGGGVRLFCLTVRVCVCALWQSLMLSFFSPSPHHLLFKVFFSHFSTTNTQNHAEAHLNCFSSVCVCVWCEGDASHPMSEWVCCHTVVLARERRTTKMMMMRETGASSHTSLLTDSQTHTHTLNLALPHPNQCTSWWWWWCSIHTPKTEGRVPKLSTSPCVLLPLLKALTQSFTHTRTQIGSKNVQESILEVKSFEKQERARDAKNKVGQWFPILNHHHHHHSRNTWTIQCAPLIPVCVYMCASVCVCTSLTLISSYCPRPKRKNFHITCMCISDTDR